MGPVPRRRALPVLLVAGALLVALAARADLVREAPLERQTLEIAEQLRCAVCQNQSVAESQAELAQDMRAIIREQLQAGADEDQIVDYFVARYGDYVLMQPPARGAGLVLWLIPPVLLLAGCVATWLWWRRRIAGGDTPR